MSEAGRGGGLGRRTTDRLTLSFFSSLVCLTRGVATTGLWDVLVKIYAKEGVPGLFKGVSPSLLKAAPTAAVTFTVYELAVQRLLPYVAQQQAQRAGREEAAGRGAR